MFTPDVPVVETVIRGIFTYAAIFILLRLVLKRQSGNVAVSDLLVMILIADAAQNAMAADYRSVTSGVVLVATIVACAYTVDWMSYKFPKVERIVVPPPLELISDGSLVLENMRKELLTRSELFAKLRAQGVEQIEDVQTACIEGDGTISVVKKKSQS